MKDTDQILESVGETIGYVQQYVEKQINYYRLETAEKASLLISSIVTMFVLFALMTFVITFGTLALGIYLGSVLDSYALSFGLITVFYVLLGLSVYFFRRQMITNPVITMIIRKIYEREEEDHPVINEQPVTTKVSHSTT